MICSECGTPLGETRALESWKHVPELDIELDRTTDGGRPLRRHFVCAAITPDRAYDTAPRRAPRRCYDPLRHQLYAGTNSTGWALVQNRR